MCHCCRVEIASVPKQHTCSGMCVVLAQSMSNTRAPVLFFFGTFDQHVNAGRFNMHTSDTRIMRVVLWENKSVVTRKCWLIQHTSMCCCMVTV